MTTEELTKILNDRVAIPPPPPKQPLSQAQLNDVMDKFATKLNDIFSKQDQATGNDPVAKDPTPNKEAK